MWAKTTRALIWAGTLVVAFGNGNARANEQSGPPPLLATVEGLDAAAENLLVVMAHSHASRADVRFAEILHQRTCRMRDHLISPYSSWARIRADYYAVRSMYRVLDRRIARNCQLHDDPHLLSAWQLVVSQFDQVCWLMEHCGR